MIIFYCYNEWGYKVSEPLRESIASTTMPTNTLATKSATPHNEISDTNTKLVCGLSPWNQ